MAFVEISGLVKKYQTPRARIDVLRGLGVKVEGFGCPMEYVESLATGRA